ncbi:hypothetical protein HAX54_002769 [Datura stramonium]|uniref:Uncharacterized protein n=1 Tax=Datura stramonium TaxID=4076 RepID=A0ABS8WRK6_DATST|nr:hypothetical protein [Datura stramonium]
MELGELKFWVGNDEVNFNVCKPTKPPDQYRVVPMVDVREELVEIPYKDNVGLRKKLKEVEGSVYAAPAKRRSNMQNVGVSQVWSRILEKKMFKSDSPAPHL